jgi:hypothetical protein
MVIILEEEYESACFLQAILQMPLLKGLMLRTGYEEGEAWDEIHLFLETGGQLKIYFISYWESPLLTL